MDDAVEGILLAAERYNDVEPLNIAVGQGHTIAELAAMVKDIVGYGGRIVYDTMKSDGALRKTGDITRMKAVLGWEPQTPIEQGIRQTLDWFVEHYDEATSERG